MAHQKIKIAHSLERHVQYARPKHLKAQHVYEIPSMHLEKKIHNNSNSQSRRLTPRGTLLESCVDQQHLAAHRTTTSSSRA